MFTPSASRQSAVPHLLDAARFPCFATGIFVDDTIIDAMVEMLIVFAPSPPVPTISNTSISFKNFSQWLLMTFAADVISSIVSPFIVIAVRKDAFCASVASPVMISSITCSIISVVSFSFFISFAIASFIIALSPLLSVVACCCLLLYIFIFFYFFLFSYTLYYVS